MHKSNDNGLHPRNKHKSGYDFEALCNAYPNLKTFVFENQHKNISIDFGNPEAVKALNTALLKATYGINYWEFPDIHLCPPIPGRVDYIHYLKDLLAANPQQSPITILDIGTGASCIYPLLGVSEYDWNFIASEIDKDGGEVAQKIIDENNLNTRIELRFQENSRHLLKGILQPDEHITACMCNPPFYKSELDAIKATSRKLKGIGNKNAEGIRNFSGTPNELWYKGGEVQFLKNYIYESALYKNQCQWFTSLISKKDHIRPIKVALKKLDVKATKVIRMHQGNKESRILAWTFLDNMD